MQVSYGKMILMRLPNFETLDFVSILFIFWSVLEKCFYWLRKRFRNIISDWLRNISVTEQVFLIG